MRDNTSFDIRSKFWAEAGRDCITTDRPLLDVIVTSSARDTIFRTIESFLENVRFSGQFRFNVNVDCCYSRNVQKIENLFRGLSTGYFTVNDPPLGFTRSVARLIRAVKTEYYFHLEDDWLFLRPIALDELITLLDNHGEIKHIRFSKEKILPFDELYYLRKLKFVPMGYQGFKTRNVFVEETPLVETMNYSANPNISRTKHFRRIPYVNSLDIEQQFALHSFVKKVIFRRRSGYYIYGRIGDSASIQHIG